MGFAIRPPQILKKGGTLRAAFYIHLGEPLFADHHGHDEHDHFLVFLLLGGNDDAGTRGVRHLEHHLIVVHVREQFHEERAFEAYLHTAIVELAQQTLHAGTAIVDVARTDFQAS